ncbi:MAG: sigma-70 family RNA polymerase sigma factor [Anaerolineales bacterium]|jgi:RNA polymerase sigma-70 factor (ECF subfamily)
MTDNRDDVQLIISAQSGDVQALATLHDRYWQTILTHVFFRVGDRVTAEDLTAEVFVRMIDNIERYQVRGSTILPWLYTITRNLIADHYRGNEKETTTLPLEDNLVTDFGNPERMIGQQLTNECLQTALQHLTDVQAQVIIAKFIEGRSNREVAQLLDRTEGAIKSLQHRALAALRKAIENEGCYEP